ncbi:MAG TPA: WYL domain-containing protein [Terriglobia bacterium]|nr:WYL domain-containing protein [Terriglobia bacterium]
MNKDGTKRRDRQLVRILGLLKTLSEGGRPSVHQLAARFRTRRETIYRDLRALQDIGYPIAGDAEGRLSHPRLFERAPIPPTGLSEEEIEAILWAVKLAGMKEPYAEALRRAEDKIRLLGLTGKKAGSPDEAITTLDRGIKRYGGHQSTILNLVEAILCKRRCLVEYQTPSEMKAWKIEYDPYRLVSAHGGLYAIGWLPSQERLITLAVERIRLIAPLQQGFKVSPGLDLKKRAEESFGIIWERSMQVVIRFRADQAPYVAEREWHPTQKVRHLKDGRLELIFKAGGLFEITRWILSWGDAAEVISPLRLKKHVKDNLRRAAAVYA